MRTIKRGAAENNRRGFGGCDWSPINRQGGNCKCIWRLGNGCCVFRPFIIPKKDILSRKGMRFSLANYIVIWYNILVNLSLAYAASAGMEIEIPPKKNRRGQRLCDKYFYKLRHLAGKRFIAFKRWGGAALVARKPRMPYPGSRSHITRADTIWRMQNYEVGKCSGKN